MPDVFVQRHPGSKKPAGVQYLFFSYCEYKFKWRTYICNWNYRKKLQSDHCLIPFFSDFCTDTKITTTKKHYLPGSWGFTDVMMPILPPIQLLSFSLHSRFLLIFCFLSTTGWAQLSKETAFQAAGLLSKELPELIHKIDDRLERDLAGLPKGNRNYLAKEYKERVDSLKSELFQENFLMDSLWNPWFQGILDKILRNNPGIPKADIRLLLSRYESPNARCVGEGTLVFNVALLPYLQNESQVAFILCHELAHYVNNHGNLALHQYINTLYSPETQKQLKDISKGKYNKTERAMALMKSMAYNGRRHGRFKESEADSLGLVFLSNTPYRLTEAITALQALDSIDQAKWPEIPYANLFNAKGFPFQKSWIETSGLGGFSGQKPEASDDFNADSLKTHPDCPQRIELTKKQLELLGKHPDGQAFIQEESRFENLRHWTDYEVIEGLYDRGEYGRALFRTLVLLRQNPEDAHLNAMVIKSLYELCLFQRSHQLRLVLDLPNPEFSSEYNRYLKFINQFRVSDLVKLTYHYYTDRFEQYKQTEEFAYASVLATDIMGVETEFDTRKQEYIKAFPTGKYLEEIKALEP